MRGGSSGRNDWLEFRRIRSNKLGKQFLTAQTILVSVPHFRAARSHFAEFPGLKLVSSVAAEIRLPWFAIGGIDILNVVDVTTAGAARVAVSGAICRSASPVQAAKCLISAISTPVVDD